MNTLFFTHRRILFVAAVVEERVNLPLSGAHVGHGTQSFALCKMSPGFLEFFNTDNHRFVIAGNRTSALNCQNSPNVA